MDNQTEVRAEWVRGIVRGWLDDCTRHGRVSRNTIAVGLVVIDRLKAQCPLQLVDLLSKGGEVRGARSSLGSVLERHGLPRSFLREATTRQAHQDGQRLLERLQLGDPLCGLTDESRRAALTPAAALLVAEARNWLGRQHLTIPCNRSDSPAAWVHTILTEAAGRSGGVVEQHLVGAKLQHRFPNTPVPNHPGHAGDAQTGRPGDFVIGSTAYHVTASPGAQVIDKCRSNLDAGLHPVLLVPREKLQVSSAHAEALGTLGRITIIAIEDFVTLNIIEMSNGHREEFITVLRAIIDTYNERLKEVETDPSLAIHIQ